MASDIAQCASKYGFELISSEEVEDIAGSAYLLKHGRSGARLLYLKNDDPNKSFSISFRTPASDDTGVFHILEHSVLCGSQKYPLKEPFVNLLKSSMQTFLNAMTFPDKTMYPVASTNEKDLLNLASVYLDAVFKPNIYTNPHIFQQEGWHLELLEDAGEDVVDQSDVQKAMRLKEDGKCALAYNGVVFNEMKGALSNPESMLFNALSASLFPDTTYRFESGGRPDEIPHLTYEQFLENHRKHYRTDNCYINLYGNLDLERFLDLICTQYLNPLAPSVQDGSEATVVGIQKPVIKLGVAQEMVTAKENSCAAMGFVASVAADAARTIAVDILVDALMGSNTSPLKAAIIEADIAQDCRGSLVDSLIQPFVMISAINTKSDDACDKLKEIIGKEVRKLADGALDHKLISASLSRAEFIMKEREFGYPDGVALAISSMSSWLYDDDKPLEYIECNKVFKDLRKRIDQGYFEDLLREVFLDNDHYAQARIVPVEGEQYASLEEQLEALTHRICESELDQIAKDVESLRQFQSSEDTPEQLSKLPMLSLEDVSEEAKLPDFGIEAEGGQDIVQHDIATNKIMYVNRYYSLDELDMEDLQYASVLSMLLGELGVRDRSAKELDIEVSDKLGSLNFSCKAFEPKGQEGKLSAKMIASASALDENVAWAAELVASMVATSDFEDFKMVEDILRQKKVTMERAFSMAGNVVALQRVAASYSKAGMLRDAIGGIGFYVFLKSLLDDFESNKDQIASRLRSVSSKVFVEGNCLVSLSGSKQACDEYLRAWDAFDIKTARSSRELVTSTYKPAIPTPESRQEAFIVPSDVTYTAVGANMHASGAEYSGVWLVASKILSYDYLWNAVRVKGGAYGVGFSAARSGACGFYSYRDPHVNETIDRFADSADWLESFDPTQSELLGYLISTLASFDEPLKPAKMMALLDSMLLTGYTSADRSLTRQEVLHATVEQLHGLSDAIRAICAEGNICTIGNGKAISSSRLAENAVELLEI